MRKTLRERACRLKAKCAKLNIGVSNIKGVLSNNTLYNPTDAQNKFAVPVNKSF